MTEAAAAPTVRTREYETIYVLRPTVTREGSEKISTRVGEVIQREGGQLTLVENWGRRGLAYKVSKHRRGVYFYLKYVGGGVIVSELERNLRMLDDVIKYQTVKTRDDVDAAALNIDPEQVKFEPFEPPEEDEPEESLARILGLEEAPRDTGRRAEAEHEAPAEAAAPAAPAAPAEEAPSGGGDKEEAPASTEAAEGKEES